MGTYPLGYRALKFWIAGLSAGSSGSEISLQLKTRQLSGFHAGQTIH
jgi:hypothetical protein